MQILSIQFLFFVSAVFILNWTAKARYRRFVLLVSSILFLLTFGNIIHCLYAGFVVVFVFFVDHFLGKKNNKYILWVQIFPLLLMLCFFKYIGLFNVRGFIMPIGISFYTFKAISYLVDIRLGKISSQKFLDLATYILFFPVLTAGPINRPANFFRQLKEGKTFFYPLQKDGAVLTAFGLFQKLVFADYFQSIVNTIFLNEELTGWYLVLGVVLFAVQIYLDFDAYSNISIGISKMLGFEVERNFKQPYLAASIKEFWQRWHISLSSWFRDYLYIPLGGNRKGNIRKYLNMLIVFIVSGIWHGSTAGYVLWGLGHGIVNIIEDIVFPKSLDKSPIFVRIPLIIFNFIIVSLLFVVFRSSNFAEITRIFSNLFLFQGFNLETIDLTIRQGVWMLIILIVVGITDCFRNKHDMIQWLSKQNIVIRWGIYAGLILIAIIFGIYGPGYNPSDFIYNAY